MVETQVVTEASIFGQIAEFQHEQVVYCHDHETGLKAIIGIHNTVLGPALGGTRMWHYASDAEALHDVLRLSRGMTYKAAISGLNLGGGKAVIIGDAATMKTEALLRKFGRFVQNLNGKYITAEDVNMTTRDMEFIRMETKHVSGLPESMGGSGDPSPVTAYGTYMGMKAAAKRAFGSDSLAGKRIAVQGMGHVGTYLLEYLQKEGAQLIVSDYYEDRALDARPHHRRHSIPVTHRHDTGHADPHTTRHRLLDRHLGHGTVLGGDASHRLQHPHRAARIGDRRSGAPEHFWQNVTHPAALTGGTVVRRHRDPIRSATGLHHSKEAVLRGRTEHHLDGAPTLAQDLRQPEERRGPVAPADEHARNGLGRQREGPAQRSDDVDGVMRAQRGEPLGAGALGGDDEVERPAVGPRRAHLVNGEGPAEQVARRRATDRERRELTGAGEFGHTRRDDGEVVVGADPAGRDDLAVDLDHAARACGAHRWSTCMRLRWRACSCSDVTVRSPRRRASMAWTAAANSCTVVMSGTSAMFAAARIA